MAMVTKTNFFIDACINLQDIFPIIDWKNVKDKGMGVRKGTVVSFVLPCLVTFWKFHPYMSLHFFFIFDY